MITPSAAEKSAKWMMICTMSSEGNRVKGSIVGILEGGRNGRDKRDSVWPFGSNAVGVQPFRYVTRYTEILPMFEIGWWDTPRSSTPAGIKAAVEEAQTILSTSNNTKSTTALTYSGNSLVGRYAGHGMLHSDAATTAVQQFTEYLDSEDALGGVLLQYCGVNSNKGLGIVVDTTGDFATVQSIVRDWNEAKCQTDFDGSKTVSNAPLQLGRPFNQTNSTSVHLNRRHSHHGVRHIHHLHRRATCATIQVVSGDSCASLAEENGITGAKFEEYNDNDDLRSTLALGRHVCCKSGKLPDPTPKPEPNGTCASIAIEARDSGTVIAAANGLSIDKVESFNKGTWGWMGCVSLQPSNASASVKAIRLGQPVLRMPSAVHRSPRQNNQLMGQILVADWALRGMCAARCIHQ